MMNLYDASVPVLQRYIMQLALLLRKIPAEHETALLQASIAPDMRPLWQQILIALGFALRATASITGQAIPQFDFQAKSLLQLQHDIEYTLDFLAQLTPESFTHTDAITISHQAGQANHEMAAPVYLQHFALPNFFFHLTCVYAILRQRGISLSKGDFDGFHQYN
ncbi:MAG: DUF1993 family protein [Formosimonas sp.]